MTFKLKWYSPDLRFPGHKIVTSFGPVPSIDMQTCHFLLSFAPISMKDAHSTESNKKSIFRFLFFELWLIAFPIYGWRTGIFDFLFFCISLAGKSPKFSVISINRKFMTKNWQLTYEYLIKCQKLLKMFTPKLRASITW